MNAHGEDNFHALKIALHHALVSAESHGRSILAISAETDIPATTLHLLSLDADTTLSDDEIRRLVDHFYRKDGPS